MVPFNAASSLSCCLLCSFRTSSTGCNSFSTIPAAASSASCVSASTKTCKSSFSAGSGFKSLFCCNLPSFTEPFPRMTIFAPVSRSILFWVLPLGPIISPIKL
ncbi:hypothetical protein EUGRSUZ_K00172 [Eucalyptus grandis]|uniref:Uncharacterized protein n=2 Tax=Eucalyptus grandis TaxID=71139 RepID=A0ACC3IPC4_EUCGR|nr:hypothetical protein EUGRSUZ_K00172 [Eucalyptus grandis]